MYPSFEMDAFGRWQRAPERRLMVHFGEDDVSAVRYGVRLLRETLPDVHDRVFTELREMKPSGLRVCGPNTIACTFVNGDERTLYFSTRPSLMDPVELAITIGHESLHHYTSGGVHFRIDHTCKGEACRYPSERAKDAIYVWEDRVRPHVRAMHEFITYAESNYVEYSSLDPYWSR
jgi:hypothetical protein